MDKQRIIYPWSLLISYPLLNHYHSSWLLTSQMHLSPSTSHPSSLVWHVLMPGKITPIPRKPGLETQRPNALLQNTSLTFGIWG